EIKKKTELGLEAKRLIDDGNYVSDKMIIEILKSKISSLNKTGYIFDGFPRTINQANELQKIFANYKTSLTTMISINVDNDELIKRLILRAEKSERPDDRDEKVILKRLEIYKNVTSELINYYKNINKHHSIDGNNSINKVFTTICKKIEDTKT
nr:nucleoside monophosphate kinase [Bacteroidales bacterium]